VKGTRQKSNQLMNFGLRFRRPWQPITLLRIAKRFPPENAAVPPMLLPCTRSEATELASPID
jgi:hypothetical protein